MNSTAAGLPFTVTDVPSRLTGNLPLTISVASFHLRESPAGARPVPKMATHEPLEDWPASRKAGVVHDARDCRFRGVSSDCLQTPKQRR